MVADFHSHVLPRIDDGSRSVEESLEMLRRAAKQNVPTVVATPHFYAQQDGFERFLARRETAVTQLKQEMELHPGLPKVVCGAEVYYFRGISETEILRELAIEGTDHILIEMPFAHWTEDMYRELEAIPDKQGLQPIVAHVDRYIAPFSRNENLHRLLDMPVLIQANTSFFLNRKTRNMAMRMLAKGQIHLLGSDCHNLDSRPPNLGEAVEWIRGKLGEETILEILENQKLCFGK